MDQWAKLRNFIVLCFEYRWHDYKASNDIQHPFKLRLTLAWINLQSIQIWNQIISSLGLLAGSRGVKRRAGPLSHVSARLISDTVAVRDICLWCRRHIFGDNTKNGTLGLLRLTPIKHVSMPVELVFKFTLPSAVLLQSTRAIEVLSSSKF